jgi:hypothetical protein
MADCGTIWQGAVGLQPHPHPILEFKNTDLVDMTMSKVLRDLLFNQKRPLKSADELVC